MKEKDLIELGFDRSEDQTPEMTGYDYTYHYYTLDFSVNDSVFDRWCLVSNSSAQAGKDGWDVRIFDSDVFRFTNRYQLEKLIEVLKYNVVTDEQSR